MPAGGVVLGFTERVCLEYLAGNSARTDPPLRVAGLEIVITALSRILVPMISAFGQDPALDQYRELSDRDSLRAANEALGLAELQPSPRTDLATIRERAIATAIDQGLSEGRAQELVDRALEAIQKQVAVAPARRT